jgi:hypothetical protein
MKFQYSLEKIRQNIVRLMRRHAHGPPG